MPPGSRYQQSGLAGNYGFMQPNHLMQQHAGQHHLPNNSYSHQGHGSNGPSGPAGARGPMNILAPPNSSIPNSFNSTTINSNNPAIQPGQMNLGANAANRELALANARRNVPVPKQQNKHRIRDVWANNLEQEMQVLRNLVEKYPYVAMDTEFPGVVARPMGAFTSRVNYHYQCLRVNVDMLNIIQLGITIFDENGETPPAHEELGSYGNQQTPCPTTWQFNFKFDTENDMYNSESIDFLTTQSGIDLNQHLVQGIEPNVFGSLLITSGFVMFEEVKWISYHSGYDFAYLVKIMHAKELPDNETDYRRILSIFFPTIYDIKYMVKAVQRSHSQNTAQLSPEATRFISEFTDKEGLQGLADELGVRRLGVAHTAGSDSLLTGRVFWDLKRILFNGQIDDSKYAGQVWGLNGVLSSSSGGSDFNTPPNLNGAVIYNQNNQNVPGNHPGSSGQMYATQGAHQGGGAMTPGAGGGVFGRFNMNNAGR